ncbi:MAG: hypothetical protein IPG08_17530 [Sphingobacteriaceae bacterium]|nr:hypothetical protein [Sphingobacteriaceae bacterium]
MDTAHWLSHFYMPSPASGKWIALTAIGTSSLFLIANVSFILYWIFHQHPVLNQKHLTLFRSDDIELFIDFYFDQATAVFALIGGVITFFISLFSRFYLHRDDGYKRYFSVLLLFFLSYNILIFSGNFETFFVGWELLGVCSFLLIAFYRQRYLPVRNSLKVISIFRLGDICLILAMWMSHHLWHENITFLKLQNLELVNAHLSEHSGYALFIVLMIVVAAVAKSAQFPFSSWLPRAMEGPTTSTAIFYGALSVHIGVYLLLRTYPYWENLVWVKVLIITIGAISSLWPPVLPACNRR